MRAVAVDLVTVLLAALVEQVAAVLVVMRAAALRAPRILAEVAAAARPLPVVLLAVREL